MLLEVKKEKRNAFTLVELLVAAAVLALFSAGIYQIVTFGLNAWEHSRLKVDIQQNVRTAISHISRELRTAKSYEITNEKKAVVMFLPAGDEIRYYLKNNQVLRDVNGAGHNVVAYGISSLTLNETGKNGVVEIHVKGITGFELRTKVFVRASPSL
ncbi:MAG: ComGF family competence protein [Clostridia bacterium]|nr:ComGF family competence protein [Clostridia bacterium]